MKKLILFSLLCASTLASGHALSIGFGLRAGGEVSLNVPYPGANPIMQEISQSYYWNHAMPVSGQAIFGAFIDVGLASIFSITPQVQFSLMRGAHMEIGHNDTDEMSKIAGKYNTIDVDLLAKFHLGTSYIAIGPGLSLHTPVKFTVESSSLSQSSFTIPASTRFNLVIDSGAYIPIDHLPVNHSLTIGLRTTIDVLSVAKILGLKLPQDPSMAQVLDAMGHQNDIFTPIAVGFSLGYHIKI
jgi:hypothetical protein